jgi:ubiquinone/menaquinone biosynthesis C-methylase UbiE
LNLPFYRNSREVIGLEPAPRLIAMARGAAEKAFTPVTFIEGSAAAIPIEDRSVDGGNHLDLMHDP